MYPKGLCRGVFKGVTDQLRADRLLKQGCYGIQVADDEHEALKSMCVPEQGYSGRYKDDLTVELLKDELVVKARRVELEYFQFQMYLEEGAQTERASGHWTRPSECAVG